jgi:hypothetical protein
MSLEQNRQKSTLSSLSAIRSNIRIYRYGSKAVHMMNGLIFVDKVYYLTGGGCLGMIKHVSDL